MTTQRQKFELFARLQALGFTYEESAQLRRIEMTLHRWAEQECGDGNDYASWSIERDETTGRPFRCVYPHEGKSRRYPIADREAGALKRLAAIVGLRNNRNRQAVGNFTQDLHAYHQTDPRGCALYLVTRSDIPDGSSIDSIYTRGLAVCA